MYGELPCIKGLLSLTKTRLLFTGPVGVVISPKISYKDDTLFHRCSSGETDTLKRWSPLFVFDLFRRVPVQTWEGELTK